MKYLIAALIALASPAAALDDCTLEISVGSKHFGFENENLNEFNPGLGFGCEVNGYRLGALVAKNSINTTSVFVMGTKDWPVWRDNVFAGGGIGLAWYQDLPDHTTNWDYEIVPVGGVHLRVNPWGGTGGVIFGGSYVPGGGSVVTMRFSVPLGGQ